MWPIEARTFLLAGVSLGEIVFLAMSGFTDGKIDYGGLPCGGCSWRAKKPTLRTHEMICGYFIGVADLDELLAHIETLKKTGQPFGSPAWQATTAHLLGLQTTFRPRVRPKKPKPTDDDAIILRE